MHICVIKHMAVCSTKRMREGAWVLHRCEITLPPNTHPTAE